MTKVKITKGSSTVDKAEAMELLRVQIARGERINTEVAKMRLGLQEAMRKWRKIKNAPKK